MPESECQRVVSWPAATDQHGFTNDATVQFANTNAEFVVTDVYVSGSEHHFHYQTDSEGRRWLHHYKGDELVTVTPVN